MIAKNVLIGAILTIQAVYLWKLANVTPAWIWELGMLCLVLYWILN